MPGPDDEPVSPFLFDTETEMEWSPVWSLRDQCFRYLPTSALYFHYTGHVIPFHADSNGCAAGNTREEAIVQGFLELVERDSYAIWWYNRLKRPDVNLDKFNNSYVRDLQIQLGRKRQAPLGAGHHKRSRHSELRGHSALDDGTGQEYIEFGSGAHFDARIAMLRTLTELNQFLSMEIMAGGARLQGEPRRNDAIAARTIPSCCRATAKCWKPSSTPKFSHLETHEQVTPAWESPRSRASISSSSIKRAPILRRRLCGSSFLDCGISIAASDPAAFTTFRSSWDG